RHPLPGVALDHRRRGARGAAPADAPHRADPGGAAMTAATAITTDTRQRRSDVDPDTLRSVLGSFCTGVTVVTAHDGDRPYGFACQSVTSLSLEPPYVSLCPARTSTSWPAMRAAGRLCIN